MKSGYVDTNVNIISENLVSASIGREGASHSSELDNEVAEATSPAAEAKPERRFGYMFPNLMPLRPPDEGLVALGEKMFFGSDLGENPSLPAGYTFLGQFIAHDLSLNENLDIPPTPINAYQVKNKRSPFLDLDSVYGEGPSKAPQLYEADGACLKVGDTTATPSDDANRVYQNDLPRGSKGEAIIGDIRNDENLALAQTHVAFLKFHNSVVDRLCQENQSPSPAIFKAARKKVIQHYQWIVLHDYLPKIVEEDVLKDALKNGSRHFNVQAGKEPFIPVEFSLAAFRLGHSMLAGSFEWNRVFQSPPRGKLERATFVKLLIFTGFGGLEGNLKLPSNWIIDWTRFFDFTGFNGIANNPKFNRAKRLDTTLTPALTILKNLLPFITKPEFHSLPVLDLVRGSRLGLPSGQAVANRLGLTPLQPGEIIKHPFLPLFRTFKFDKKTPLWYYILREAQLFHDGKRLGPVGSRIVAETFVELIRLSPISILKERGWKPDLGQRERDAFSIADLLVSAGVVNPLGS